MSKLTFYQQVRVDGGRRIGVDSDAEELLQCFQDGTSDTNPTLLWFVDIRCEGDRLPGDGEGARAWFANNRDYFAAGLRNVAREELCVGFDTECYPAQCRLPLGPDNTTVEIVVSAMRRIDGRSMGQRLVEFADEWDSLLGQLLLPSPV